MDDETATVGWIIAVVFVVAFVILCVISGLYKVRLGELGNAICEKEYGEQYDWYYGGVLECQPKPLVKEENLTMYDGIKVRTGGT